MENLTERIEEFLQAKYGYGYGGGDGSGYGCGGGDGSGYGCGGGSDDGYGYGSGDGYGCGGGDGSGYGYGCGGGDGSGYGNLSTFNGSKVFEVDGIPCVFLSVFRDYAKVLAIKTLNAKELYVAKCGDFFAHGETLREAFRDAKSKYDENRPLEDRIRDFWGKFVPGKKYLGSEFFEWHHVITGSCLAGRNEFVRTHGLSTESEFTPEEFIALCENEYGSNEIAELKKAMPKGEKNVTYS